MGNILDTNGEMKLKFLPRLKYVQTCSKHEKHDLIEGIIHKFTVLKRSLSSIFSIIVGILYMLRKNLNLKPNSASVFCVEVKLFLKTP